MDEKGEENSKSEIFINPSEVFPENSDMEKWKPKNSGYSIFSELLEYESACEILYARKICLLLFASK